LWQGHDRALYADGVEEYAVRWVCVGLQWEDRLPGLSLFASRECDRAEALLERVAFLDYFIHCDTHMTLVIDTFPVADEQYLG